MHKQHEIKLFAGALMLFFITNLFAQAPDTLWTKTYGGTGTDVGECVQQTTDNGYIIAGYTNSFGAGGYDVYLIKTNSLGNIIWEKTYGGTDDDKGYSVKQTADEGYIIAGVTESYGAGYEDVYLIKTDANGDAVWTKTYGTSDTDIGYSVDELTAGGYIIAGTTAPGYIPKDYLMKTDANGEVIWTKTYGSGMMSWWKEVQETDDGAYITAGWMMSPNDVYLAKTNSDGGSIWTKTINLGDDQYGNAVQQTSDGGYIIAGETWSNDTQKWDFCLIKRNANGDAVWAKTYGGTEWDKAYSVKQVLWDEGYIIAGVTESYGAGGKDVYLVRTDPIGDTLWTQTYGGSGADNATSVQQTSDYGYIIAGATSSFGAGSGDVYLIKTAIDLIGIEENQTLAQNLSLCVSPNPFSKLTNITLKMIDNRWKMEDASLRIYDATGRVVKDFSRFTLDALRPTRISWDGTDESGNRVQNGVYFIKFAAGEFTRTEKLVFLR